MAACNKALSFLSVRFYQGNYYRVITIFLAILFSVMPVKSYALGAPLNPTSSDEIIITFDNKISPEMSELGEKLKQNPQNEQVAKQLIGAHLYLSKLTGDERYLGYAMSIINHWPPEMIPVNVLLLKARVIQRQHHFSEALDILNKIVEINPRSGEAHLLAAYIHMAQGELEAAGRSCARAGPLLGAKEGLVCTSRVQGLSGHGEKAYQILRLILAQAGDVVDPAYTEGYLNLAEIATRLDKQQDAEKYYRFAIDSEKLNSRNLSLSGPYPSDSSPSTISSSLSERSAADPKTISGLVDLLMAQGRYKECLTLLESTLLKSDSKTPLPLTMIQLLLVKEALGKSVSKEREMLQRYFDLEKIRNENYTSRDYSRYLLEIANEDEQAFSAALDNWQSQREPDDLLILLKSAKSIGESENISEVLAWRENLGLEDVRIDRLLKK